MSNQTNEQQAVENLIMELSGMIKSIPNCQRINTMKAIGAAVSHALVELGDDYANAHGLDNERRFDDVNEPIQEMIEIIYNDIQFEIDRRIDREVA
jgi:hypothetical protein